MAVTFGGLASGLDTNALIDGLMAVERIPLARNQAKQLDLTSAKDTISSVISKVSAVTRTNKIEGYYFQRVFVDEVDSIRIPSFPFAYAKQTWFITSSINNIPPVAFSKAP